MCDMGYLCANFCLPRPLCSRLRPDVCDRRQTDRRQTASSLNDKKQEITRNSAIADKPDKPCDAFRGQSQNMYHSIR